MKFGKIAAAALAMSISAFAADATDNMTLKGNVQTQVTKSIADEDNNFSSGWIRANIGGQYKSDNLDGTIMLRIFAPEFGNKIKDGDGKTTSYDKILADLYWVNYKWALNDDNQLNLKIGRWKTDWSQSTHFGTYVDKDLTKRGLWMRDYSHNAVELGWKHGLNQLNAMVAAKNGTANQGYVRVEDDMKFTFPLEVKVAYRANLVDVVQNSAYITHRVAAYASYEFLPILRAYGEYACVYTQDDEIDPNVENYLAPNPSITSRASITSRSTWAWISPRRTSWQAPSSTTSWWNGNTSTSVTTFMAPRRAPTTTGHGPLPTSRTSASPRFNSASTAKTN